MIKSFGKHIINMPCRLSWLLVEVNQGSDTEYFVIHWVEVIGDINGAYLDKKIRFSQERREIMGIVRLASDNLQIVEAERARLLLARRNLISGTKPFEADLWCLVQQIDEEKKVQLSIVSCKKLISMETADEKRKKFIMQEKNSKIPVALLYASDSENQLLAKMESFNNEIVQNYLYEEKDSAVGLEELYLLVQYFQDRNNLIYTVVNYKDTVFKEENLFKNVVAYIHNEQQKTVSQSIILGKSFRKEELIILLESIRKTCYSVDFRLLNAAKVDGI